MQKTTIIKIGKIGVVALVLAFLVPILGIESMLLKKVAVYLIIGGVTLIGIAMHIEINKDLK